jgi:hypothetical protein
MKFMTIVEWKWKTGVMAEAEDDSITLMILPVLRCR